MLSPRWEYDVVLNSYFQRPQLVGAPWNSNANRARALAGFLTFVYRARGGRGWREATDADHLAYHQWRRRDTAGPRVSGGTWSQDVSHVNQFYVWAAGQGQVGAVPIPHRPPKLPPWGTPSASRAQTVPATYAHDRGGERIEWLPPASYRLWRDVGLRGYGSDGLPSRRFRGRWAARNAAFTDLMVRTGMRLSEQAHLTTAEMPVRPATGGYQRFWLPGAIAKYFSARWVYVPHSVVRELAVYAELDRAEVVGDARASGVYRRWRRPLVIDDPARPQLARVTGSATRRTVSVRELGPTERRRLLVESLDGLEPALFWLGEDGQPLAVSTWKSIFTDANKRCKTRGVVLSCHAHLLRHSFAVVTLEQLQRGHIAALGELNEAQRGHYTRIFGDPLDWVRRRLGHRSVVTTTVYLHALQELEMETRMALVPDTWEDPRDTPLQRIGDDTRAPAESAGDTG
ncbi:site-specific integrase [Streptomyces sp. AgN23]|uniref:site-specific integrase n=1 Tax=Streptomyces sp. AgN23 TaxID=1188315 RepID=UPI001B31AD25|nr:site-specific integrase [Streptomyces sp. AgN23]QTI90627.1 site-specific integrase [Streptomyces sp. AgN23]